MFCIKCGVKLADTEKTCPLCGTVVYHPDLEQAQARPVYPKNKIPEATKPSQGINGAILFLFLFPALISLLIDLHMNDGIDWFGYVVGGLGLVYIAFALPLWFYKPNPVIFTPCNFAALALYLQYINFVTGGHWFLSFAFPVVGALCVIVSTVVTLLHYLHKGKLYIWGGAFIALGGLMLLIEFLLSITFSLRFIGWSFYPLVGFVMCGGFMIYLAINRSAREMMERKLFF